MLAGTQPRHLQTDSLYDDLNKRHNNCVFDAILADAIFLKDSLHGAKKKRGGWGQPPPPFANIFVADSGFLRTSLHGIQKSGSPPPPFANTFITGFERVHMGSVFAGANILEATLRRAFGNCRLLI